MLIFSWKITDRGHAPQNFTPPSHSPRYATECRLLYFDMAWSFSYLNVSNQCVQLPETVTIAASFFCALLLIVLFCWADKLKKNGEKDKKDEKGESDNDSYDEKMVFPDPYISVISAFFFTYARKIIWKGFKGTVGPKDLWSFPPWSKVSINK